LIGYSGGATVSVDERAFEVFNPSAREKAEFDARFPWLAEKGHVWPEQYTA
jgi:hypothetical protein